VNAGTRDKKILDQLYSPGSDTFARSAGACRWMTTSRVVRKKPKFRTVFIDRARRPYMVSNSIPSANSPLVRSQSASRASRASANEQRTGRAPLPPGATMAAGAYYPRTKNALVLVCAIGGTPMKDPVFGRDALVYEREAIERAIDENGRSPITGVRLKKNELIPCATAKRRATTGKDGAIRYEAATLSFAQPENELDDSLLDPIEHVVIEDPVLLPSGHTYGRASVRPWLEAHGSCPLTSRKLDGNAQLVRNRVVLEALAARHGTTADALAAKLGTPDVEPMREACSFSLYAHRVAGSLWSVQFIGSPAEVGARLASLPPGLPRGAASIGVENLSQRSVSIWDDLTSSQLAHLFTQGTSITTANLANGETLSGEINSTETRNDPLNMRIRLHNSNFSNRLRPNGTIVYLDEIARISCRFQGTCHC